MEHFNKWIEGWSHYLEPAYSKLVPTLPDHCEVVEVGCWHGKSTAYLAVELINSKTTFNLYAVDHWYGCNEDYYQLGSNKESIANNEPYKKFVQNMAPVADRLTIIRMRSAAAARKFADNSLDMVVLDDDHSYESVMNSIQAWAPKVKPGGILIGDDCDMHYPGVSRSVREFFGENWKLFHLNDFVDNKELPGCWVWTKPDNWTMPTIEVPADPWAPKTADIAYVGKDPFTEDQIEALKQIISQVVKDEIQTAVQEVIQTAVQDALEKKFRSNSLQNAKPRTIM